MKMSFRYHDSIYIEGFSKLANIYFNKSSDPTQINVGDGNFNMGSGSVVLTKIKNATNYSTADLSSAKASFGYESEMTAMESVNGTIASFINSDSDIKLAGNH